MKAKALTCLVVVLCCFAWSFGAEIAYLPQVADGTFAGGSMRTTFIIFNPGSVSDSVTIRLTNDAGQAMSVTIPGQGTGAVFGPITIGPGQTKILQTAGTGPITAGAARVESQNTLGVSAIFTLYSGTGAFLTEAGVGGSDTMTDFVIPVDASGSFNTGLALYAPANSTLTFTLRRTDGSVAGTTTTSMTSGRHLAKFVAGGEGLFPNASNFSKGTLQVSCTTPVAAVTLRQNGNPLSNTTLPVVDKYSTSTDFNLPQIANGGDLAGTNMRTTFIVFNISSSDADVDIDIRKPDGTGFPVSVQGIPETPAFSATPDQAQTPEQSSTIHLTLKPGESKFLQTTGTGPLSVGSAQLTSTVPVGVSAIFTLYNGQAFLTEAGVGDAFVSDEVTLPVDISSSSNTGVAIFNPEDAPATIDIWLLDESGANVGHISTPLNLGGHSQTAKYVSELFPGKTNFRGSMALYSSTSQISAVALRANNVPISYTTLPVARGANEGTTPTAGPLLDVTKTGIAATSNTVVDATLPSGFRLSGTVSGALGTLSEVSARSTATGGRTYIARTDALTNKYLVVVPAGTYELSVCYMPDSLIPLGLPTLNYIATPNVSVNADTVRDINVPSVTLRTIMGTVTGLPGTMGTLSFASSDGKTGATALIMSGNYSIQLPDSTYTVSLMSSALSSSQSLLGLYNIGSLTVNAATSMANFTVPATVTLSGVVTRAGATGMPAASFITVGDLTAAAVQPTLSGCADLVAGSMGSITPATGAYQLLVPKSRNLNASVMFSVDTPGFIMFPATGRDLGSLSADRTENFNVPALPGTVTISGKVTDSQGQAVAGVGVGAYSTQITGAASVMFSAGATTDAGGNYSFKVLNGTNYQVSFVPPAVNP